MEEVGCGRASREALRGTLLAMTVQRVEGPGGTRDMADVDPEPRDVCEERR